MTPKLIESMYVCYSLAVISSAERLLFDDDPPLNFSFSSSNAVTAAAPAARYIANWAEFTRSIMGMMMMRSF